MSPKNVRGTMRATTESGISGIDSRSMVNRTREVWVPDSISAIRPTLTPR